MAKLRVVDSLSANTGAPAAPTDEEVGTRLLAYVMAGSEPEAIIQRAVSAVGLLPEVSRVELAASPSPDTRGCVEVPCGATCAGSRFLRAWLRQPNSPMARRRILSLLGLVARVYAREAEIQRLHDEAHTDPLTGMFNRRAFEPFVDQALARAQRSGEDVALMLCDVDNFKEINDSLGHTRGDVALRAVCHAIRSALRPTDLASRWGGDEFAILLASCNASGARNVATRIQEALDWDKPLRSQRLTLSIGIADAFGLPRGPLSPWQAREIFFRAADEAVYMAKEAGRNTHVCHPSCYRVDEIDDSDITLPIRLECG